MKTSGIYKIICKPTGKFYIGSSIDIKRRWVSHKSELKRNIHRNSYLQRAWNKYSEENFELQIIETVDPKLLLESELKWFKITNCCNRQFGFNIETNPENPITRLGYNKSVCNIGDDTLIIDLYLNKKLSCADIAVEDGRSESTIYKILLKNKVQMRNKSEANQIFDDCLLRFMYNLGLSLSQIAEVLGIDATTISKRFTLIGFPTRIPCQAKGVRYTKEEFKRFFMNDRFKKLIKEVN